MKKFLLVTVLVISIGCIASFFLTGFRVNKTAQVAATFTTNTTGDWNSHTTWGVNLAGLTQLNRPYGLDFSSTGELYIADMNNNRTTVLNPDGTASTTFPTAFFNSQQICYRDVAISPNGYLYVPDPCNSRVIVFSLNGVASTSYSIPNSGPEKIFINSLGEWYIAAANPARIEVFNSDGTASTTLGLGIISTPNRGFTVAPSGDIYIYEITEDRISVLQPNGTYFSNYTGFTPGGDAGMSVSADGYVYVTDRNHNQIVVLNPDGSASTTLNGDTFAPINPNGVRIAPSGEIYISDDLHRIVILNPDGTASTSYNGLAVVAGYVEQAGVDYPGASDNIVINTGTVTLTQDEYVHNVTLASGGTLDLAGYTLYVSGDWTNTGGTLINNNGTINLNGTSQSINGANTFQNLIKIATTTSSLTFDPDATTTVTDTLNLSGASDGLLMLIGPAHLIPPAYLSKFGTPGSGDGQLNGPYGIFIDSSGNQYITDQNNSRLQKFDANGVFIAKVGSSGIGGGQFCHPRDIVMDSSNDLYVVDGCNRVAKFDSDLNFIMQFGSTSPASGSGNGEFNTAWGIAIDSSDILHVLDGGNNRVQKFDTDGTYISQFTVPSSSGNARGIAVDQDGNVYVANGNAQKIQKFDTNGNLLLSFGENGVQPGQFCSPHHVVLDVAGNMYVSDFCNHVQIFDPSGTWITDIGSAGSGNGQFSNPYGIFVTPDETIHIVDSGNNRIQTFSPAQQSTFNILSLGNTNLSYLSVSHSNNAGISELLCLLGCVDGGGNTNWVFPIAPENRRTGSAISSLDVGGDTLASTSSLSITATATATAQTQEEVSEPTATAQPISPSRTNIFTRFLYPGFVGEDVRQLQIFLNTHGFPLAQTGAGSMGNETTYFGPRTQTALTKFQEANRTSILEPQGLQMGTGIFWRYSLRVISSLLGFDE